MTRQVTGGACRLIMYPETSPKVADSAKGVVIALNSEGFKSGSNKKTSSTIRGKRGPGKPFRGLPSLAGSLESPAYAPQLGHLVRALCGAPTTTAESVKSCTAAAVTDKGAGFVGIPCVGHGFVQDAVISIVGSTKYNGTYRVEAGTTADEIVISALYQAEALTAAAKVLRGRVAILKGAAVNAGSGKSSLPTKAAHGMSPGESITITGTTSYDGTYTLLSGTDGAALVITKAYAAETFDGSGSKYAALAFYRHVFALPQYQPTVTMEKYLDFEAGAATNPYRRYAGCKVNGFNLATGGDELVASVDMTPLAEVSSTSPLNASPASLPSPALQATEGAFWINGIRRGDVEKASFSASFGIEAKAAVGDLGRYSRNPEGDPDVKMSLECFLESDELQLLADADATVSCSLSFCGAGGEELWLTCPEAGVDSDGASITCKTGLMQNFTIMAFAENAASMLTFTIVNRVTSYA